MAEWAGIVHTTITKHLRTEIPVQMRNRKLSALLMDKGRFSYNNGGKDFDWPVQYRDLSLSQFGNGGVLTFPNNAYYKTATLNYRGYAMSDSMSEKDRLMNRGTEAIVNLFSKKSELLKKNGPQKFNEELYVDGNATGNEERICGFETCLGSGSVSASAPICQPDDSYAGLDTDLSAYGGTWTGNWPVGTGSVTYDFWSPLLVDYTSAVAAASGGWTATTKTWPNTCREAIEFSILYTMKNQGLDERMDVIFLEMPLFRQYQDTLHDYQRINVNRGQESRLVKLGFVGDVHNLNGVDITTDYGIPSGVGYGVNTSKIEIMCMYDELFKFQGPEFDIASQSYRMALMFFGNMKIESPRYFCKFKNYS